MDSAERDRVLLRVVGSPDRYGKQVDGVGGATSSTSKVVLISRSSRPDCDVDYLFGQVAVDKPVIDWSGNCGNLSAAVGPFAIANGLLTATEDGVVTVRIWQANIRKKILAHVAVHNGEVQEEGDFTLDGVAFPSAEVKLEFLDPAAETNEGAANGGMLPTGNAVDVLDVPGVGRVEATLINAGNPTIFVQASALGLRGTEMQDDIKGATETLQRAEAIRAHAAVRMGFVASAAEATARRPHTPKLAFVSPPASYTASDGREVLADKIDLVARIFSMGQLHHAMTGTGGDALAVDPCPARSCLRADISCQADHRDRALRRWRQGHQGRGHQARLGRARLSIIESNAKERP